MSAHPPPVPPANRTTKGPGDPAAPTGGKKHDVHPDKADENLAEQGDHGNMMQNIKHPAAHQDR